jgi:hypothetical protein
MNSRRRNNRPIRWLLTISLLLITIVTLSEPEAFGAKASEYVVSNLDDFGPGSLRQAIEDADAAPGQDTITFSVNGTIFLESTLPTITDPDGLVIHGPGRKSLFLKPNSSQYNMVVISSGAALTLRNLTVANFGGFFTGGAIYNLGTLEVINSTISDNSTEGGSGITNGGMLTVTDSTFSGNVSGDGDGGAVFNSGAMTVTRSIFAGNAVFGGAGGGIYNLGTLTVTDSIFSGNHTFGNFVNGGGITNWGTLTVTNSTFLNNRGSHGGGIANRGILAVTDNTFRNNIGPLGGGIYVNSGMVTVTNSTFSGNKLANSGGIYNESGIVTVTNSTFSRNSAPSGGGIYNSGTVTVTNSTFWSNSGQNDGTIRNNGTLTLQNSIVANSTFQNCTNNGTLIDGGGNLSWPDTSCPGINADPLLGPLQNNGGSTQTHALMAGSLAIDAALPVNCPATDQRGVNRPQGVSCDIGAYELE